MHVLTGSAAIPTAVCGETPTDLERSCNTPSIWFKFGLRQTHLNLPQMRLWSPLDICQGMPLA